MVGPSPKQVCVGSHSTFKLGNLLLLLLLFFNRASVLFDIKILLISSLIKGGICDS